MGRPKQDETMETVSVRLPTEMIAAIDDFVVTLKGDMPLLNINRADGVRQLLSEALGSRTGVSRRRKR